MEDSGVERRNPLDAFRGMAVSEAALLALYNSVQMRHGSTFETLTWACMTLASVEKAVQEDADQALTHLGAVREHLDDLEKEMDAFQDAAILYAPDFMERSASCKRLLFEQIPRELALCEKEVAKLAGRVAALSDTRLPSMPTSMLRPSRLAKLAEGIQRVISGYARDQLKR